MIRHRHIVKPIMRNFERVMYVGSATTMVDFGHVAGSGQRVKEGPLDGALYLLYSVLLVGFWLDNKLCARCVS